MVLGLPEPQRLITLNDDLGQIGQILQHAFIELLQLLGFVLG